MHHLWSTGQIWEKKPQHSSLKLSSHYCNPKTKTSNCASQTDCAAPVIKHQSQAAFGKCKSSLLNHFFSTQPHFWVINVNKCTAMCLLDYKNASCETETKARITVGIITVLLCWASTKHLLSYSWRREDFLVITLWDWCNMYASRSQSELEKSWQKLTLTRSYQCAQIKVTVVRTVEVSLR